MAGEKYSLESPVVLVADDDAMMRFLARESLTQTGFNVCEAVDGAEALKVFEKSSPDIVLLDVNMPNIDGFRVCAAIRKYPGAEQLPILMITGLDDVDSIRQAYDFGATDFITKPVNWMILGHRMRYIFRASQAIHALRRSEEKNRALLHAIPDAMLRVSKDGRCLEYKGSADFTPTVPTGDVIGRKLQDIFPAGAAESALCAIGRVFTNEEAHLFECRVARNGSHQDCENRVVLCGSDEALIIVRDITERKRAEEALRKSEERYALTSKGANDGLWDWDIQGGDIYYSPRWKAILGYGEDEVADSLDEWFNRVHSDDVEQLKIDISAHLDGITMHFQNEHRLLHRDGSHRWVLTRGIALRGGDGKPYRVAGSMSDITERKRAERQLIHDAFHDMLTHLPNRALVLDRLEHALKRSKRNENFLFAVLFLDLDRFKIVNDSLGHEAGDRLLIELAGRLSRCLRPGDTLSRLGGDEFVILLEDIRGDDDVEKVAGRIINMVKDPFVIDGQEVSTTVSIGIALSSSDYERPEDMLRDADTAMYRAKSLGKSRYEMFDTTMHLNVLNMLRLENDLRKALDRDQLRIHYQPVVSLENGHVNSVEALLRWYHPERGVIPPMDFIPLAEENGMIIPIGEWVLRTACHQLRLLFEDGFTPLRIAVNISARQLRQHDFAENVVRIIEETGIDARYLELEITESTIMENPDSAAEKLAKLRELGVHISLDDFGTGYSSLSYLHRFPINTLKIDRSFIERMGSDAEKFEIIRSVVSMAKKMALSVVAEGIETVEQMRTLQELNCGLGQGFLFSRPVGCDDVQKVLRSLNDQEGKGTPNS